MYGFPGSQFRASDFLAPLYGVLLGPWLAIPCVIIGTTINYAFFPTAFFGLDFMPGIVAAVSAGFLSKGKGWVTAAIFTILLVFFVSLPLSTDVISIPGGNGIPYAWLHAIGLVILLSPLRHRIPRWLDTERGLLLVAAMGLTVLSATLAQHLMGGILTILIRFPIIGIKTSSAASAYWSAIFVLYPVERMIITFVTGVLGASLIKGLKAAGYQERLNNLTRIPNRNPPKRG